MDISKLPKIELHLHLDCSLSFDLVQQLQPGITYAEYRDAFVAPAKCTDLVDYIARADKAIGLMQTGNALRMTVQDLFRQLKADHVIYAEIRFAPLLHTEKGLSPVEIVRIVDQATREGIRETGVQGGLILCTLRHFSEAQSLETVRLVQQFKNTCVVGFDIASDEAGFPIDNHVAAFQFAHAHQLNCTAHAGEARGPESVWETLRFFKPSRIGHGVRSTEDPELIRFLKQENIHLEVCPTSNIQTNVYDDISDHVVDTLYRAGVSISINTDGRTISNITLTEEYQTLHRVFGWGKEHFRTCNLEAIAHAFAPDALKAELRRMILEERF